ncbi:MAG: ribonuclease HII, partial [Gammaproteobacteria bacterium]
GRGPLVGPVVAAAVILDPARPIEGLRDSKKLSEKRRLQLAEAIRASAISWSIAEASAEEIDAINILQASLLAMQRALQGLNTSPNHVCVDGNRCPEWSGSIEAIVGGDDQHPAIMAASILAKVERDAQMLRYAEQYPAYGFAQHKGYPTRAHLAALQEHGVTPWHRRSFAPVRRVLEDGRA